MKPPHTNVEVMHSNSFSTDFEGEVNDIKIDGHSVATIKALEESLLREIKNVKKTVFVLSSLCTLLGVVALLFMLGIRNDRITDTVTMEEIYGHGVETNRQIRYMIDVRPGNRIYQPYSEYDPLNVVMPQ